MTMPKLNILLFSCVAAIATALAFKTARSAEPIDPKTLPGKFLFVGFWEASEGDDIADLLKSITYQREIYMTPADGAERRPLAEGFDSIWKLSWHRQSKALSFDIIGNKDEPHGFMEFDLSNWNGGPLDPKQARYMLPHDFPTPYYEPEWRVLPNGKTEMVPGGRRYVVRVTFSPDGTKVAGTSNERICVTDIKGTQPAKCVTGIKACGLNSPVWSPDGTKIVFVGPTPDDGGNCKLLELFIADADGQNVRQLTDIPGERYSASDRDVKPGVTGAHWHKTSKPTWSPDGQWIAFFSIQGVGKIRPDGTGFQVIATNASNPTWSPDSRMIAYTAARGDTLETFQYGIFVSWADGTGETWITRNLEMFRGGAQFVYEDLNWVE